MAAWSEIKGIPELSSTMPGIIGTDDRLDQDNDESYPLAGRWKRSFGRVFDTSIEISFLAFWLEILFERYSFGWIEWLFTAVSNQFFPLLCLPLTFILDAIIYRVFGNTPGKFLLGLTVEHVTSVPLTFLHYLKRNFYLWFSGFALGLPLVNFYRMFFQLIRLGEKKQTTYDEELEFRVRAKPIGWLRVAVFIVLFGYISSWHSLYRAM